MVDGLLFLLSNLIIVEIIKTNNINFHIIKKNYYYMKINIEKLKEIFNPPDNIWTVSDFERSILEITIGNFLINGELNNVSQSLLESYELLEK